MAAVKQRVRSRKILNSYHHNGGNLQGNVVAWFYDRWMKECGGKPARGRGARQRPQLNRTRPKSLSRRMSDRAYMRGRDPRLACRSRGRSRNGCGTISARRPDRGAGPALKLIYFL